MGQNVSLSFLSIFRVPPQSFTSTERVSGTPPPTLTETADAGGASSDSASPPAAISELKYAVEIRAGHALEATPINAALNIGDKIVSAL